MKLNLPLLHPGHENLEFSCGVNPYGAKTTLYYVPVSAVVTWGVPPVSPATLSDICVITDTHTFAASDGFTKLVVSDESIEFKSTPVGDIDGMSFEHMLDFHYPSLNPDILGFLTQYVNCPLLVLMERPNGQVIQIGTDGKPARISEGTSTTGKVSGDRAGNAYSLKAASQFAAQHYQGTITEKS